MRIATIGIVLMTLASFAPGVQAHTVTGHYDFATTPGLSIVCSPSCLGTGLNIGGFTFAANGEMPVSITIEDESGGPVPFTVCQDFDGALCGGDGEPRIVGCGTTANLASSSVAFRASASVSVFVRAVDANCAGGAATAGLIHLTYSP